ncbi:NAD(P)-dependent oxidoreductase [Streptomyces cinerochromogenes]|uniref:NAD(P)-dependent oxidoreductase n=1 Tax=Streptomyces cinerochromogenes TaxID=66422 RepID=UPI0016703BE0|nr:NAD(P)H-binding protein [Streptomyces cinerochromogenes]GGS80896.1 3-beta hydroxysteroid dehydrogenase [Streptomyces cinerochromogenes]
MKIVLLGATGMVGSRIAAEAVARGHEVVAVSRSGSAPVDSPRLTAAAGDAGSATEVAGLVEEADAVACALVPPRDGSDPCAPFAALYDAVLNGVRSAGVRRVVIVGGAGSLDVAPGTVLRDTPGFPDEVKPEADAHAALLATLRGVSDLEWTYVSPAALIAPGERTGTFRVGGDSLLTDAEGNSRISAEDYAVAFVDEIEKAAHPKARISVAY